MSALSGRYLKGDSREPPELDSWPDPGQAVDEEEEQALKAMDDCWVPSNVLPRSPDRAQSRWKEKRAQPRRSRRLGRQDWTKAVIGPRATADVDSHYRGPLLRVNLLYEEYFVTRQGENERLVKVDLGKRMMQCTFRKNKDDTENCGILVKLKG